MQSVAQADVRSWGGLLARVTGGFSEPARSCGAGVNCPRPGLSRGPFAARVSPPCVRPTSTTAQALRLWGFPRRFGPVSSCYGS